MASQRDSLTSLFENNQFTQLNQFYYDAAGLNIGFGYNLTAQIGSTTDGKVARSALSAVGLTFTTSQWNSIISAAQSPAAKSGAATALNTSVGSAATISQSQAYQLMDNYYSSVVIPALSKSLSNLGLNLLNLPSGVATGLMDLIYNAPSAITAVSGLATALSAKDWGAAAYAIEFNQNLSDTDTGRINRRIAEAMYMLGFSPTFVANNGVTSLVSISPNLSGYNNIGALISFEESVAKNGQGSNFARLPTLVQASIVGFMVGQGYYVAQSADANGSSSAANNIATAVVSQHGLTGVIDATTLQRINFAFSDASFTVGGLVHVPVGLPITPSGDTSLPALPNGYCYVYDSGKVFTVGASTNNQYGSGALIIDSQVGAGGYTSFAQGTYSGLTVKSDGTITIDLTTSNGDPLGTYNFNPSTDAGTVNFPNGFSKTIPGGSAINLQPATGTPEQVLLNYLGQMGASASAAQFDQSEDNYVDPTKTQTVAQGKLSGDPWGTSNTYPSYPTPTVYDVFTGTSNNTVTGPTSVVVQEYDANHNSYNATVTPINVLHVSGDMTLDTITNIQRVYVDYGSIMSAAQFNQFTSAGILYSQNASYFNVEIGLGGSITSNPHNIALVAVSWDGTTLLGDQLTASLYGNDTLIGQNPGANDLPGMASRVSLTAGEGVDTLTGASGGNTDFYTTQGLTSGSVVTGSGTGNTLIASGDISGAAISGVQTLNIGVGSSAPQSITLTAAQLAGFTSVTGGLPLFTSGGGVFDISRSSTALINMTANSNAGTTLIGDSANNEILTASQSGTDTLQAGSGNNVALKAGGGTNTLIAGSGTDTLLGGTGYDKYVIGSNISQVIIVNGESGATLANGEVDLSAYNFKNLWFTQDQSSLTVHVIGTNKTITLEGFGTNSSGSVAGSGFGTVWSTAVGPGAQVTVIKDTNGTSLSNSQVSALATAMATYQAAHSSFNAATATGLPSDSALQIATAYAWTGKTYSSITNNADGSWTGVINDTSGGVWTSITDSYSTLNALVTTVELFNNGSTVTTTYSSNGSNSYAVSGTLPSTASVNLPSGNNTLTLGNVTGVTENASGTTGNNALTVQDTLSNNPGSYYNNTLNASNSSGSNTLTVGDGSYDLLRADYSTGNNTLLAGNGGHAWLDAESSTGNNSLTIGSGQNNTLDVSFSSGNNTLTALTGSSDYLNGQNTTGANTLKFGDGNSNTISVAFSSGNNSVTSGNGTGTYLNAETTSGANIITAGNGANDTLDVFSSSGNNTLTAGNGDNDFLTAISSTGNNTLTSGNGNNDQLSAASSTGSNTLIAGTGNDVLIGGQGYTTYKFTSTFGQQDRIWNSGSPAGTGAASVLGEIDFGTGASFKNLWFTQSGTDLVVTQLGTTNMLTVKGWFGSNAGAEVQKLLTVDGLNISNSTVATLVSAMATYQTNNPSFNPTTATQLPANNTLLTSMVSAWTGKTYDTVTINGDNSWTAVLNDHVGGSWTSKTDFYNASQSLVTEETLNPNGSGSIAWGPTGGNGSVSFTNTSNFTASPGAVLGIFTAAGSGSVTAATGTAVTINIADTGTLAFTGSNSLLAAVNNDTVTTASSGSGDSVYTNGNYDTVTMNSTNSAGYGSGVYDAFSLYGAGDTVTVSGIADGTFLYGTGETATATSTAGSGAFFIYGNGNTGTDSGNGANITINGNNNTVTANGSNDVISIGGSNDTLTVNGGAGGPNSVTQASGTTSDIFFIYGTNITTNLAGSSDAAVVGGSNNSTTVSGNNTLLNMIANHDSLTITGTGEVIYVAGTSNSVTSYTASQAIGLGDNSTGTTVNSNNDTITIGNSASAQVSGSSNVINSGTTDTIGVDGYGNTVNGGAGYTSYLFSGAAVQATINNGFGGNTTAKGEIDFTGTLTDQNLWFQKSANGSDLLIDILGSSSQIDVANWYGSNAGADVQSINAGGLKLDTAVAQLVQAMASYTSAHSGFNPGASGTAMPGDTTLQNAITSSWHH